MSILAKTLKDLERADALAPEIDKVTLRACRTMVKRNPILAEHVAARIAQKVEDGLQRDEAEKEILLSMHIFSPIEESLVRRWLSKIDSEGAWSDPVGVEDLLAKARFDINARSYFLDRAKIEVGHVGRGDVG